MNSPLRAIMSAALLCGCALLPSSCASGPELAGLLDHPIRLVMSDFRNDLEMALVNDAWLVKQGIPGATANERKAEFFSITRSKAGSTTKVLNNRQAALLVDHLRSEFHFAEHSNSGITPPGGGYFTSAVEIEVNGQARHFGHQRGISRDAAMDLVESKRVFVAVYNQVYSLQSVEDAEGFKRKMRR